MGKLSHRPTTLKAANAFVAAHHRHNKPPRGCKFALEAIVDGEVVGVAIVGRPVARSLDDGMTLEVLRCCVKDEAPRNVASYLYGAVRRVWQTWGGARIITYNLDTESGATLRAAGFLLVAKTRAAPAGWGRKSRERTNAAIYAAKKNRWQLDLFAGV
jgi:hypothetical protein